MPLYLKASTLLLLTFLLSSAAYSQCSAAAGPDTSVCLGASVQIGGLPVAASGNAPFTYSWSPALGLSCTNCPNPIASPGSTTIYTLTITDSDGCTSSDDVLVNVLDTPTAGFTFSPVNACSNIPVTFTNTSAGVGLSFQWNFGEPSSVSNFSTLSNPSHMYNSEGSGSQSYTVTLITTNANGCAASSNQTISVLSTPGPDLTDPIADMKNCDGTSFSMTVYNTSAGTTNSNYIIQWGDGTPDFSSATFPGGGVTHTYTTAEIFDMLFIVTGANGCTDTALYNVANITNPAIGAANPGGTTGCGPLTLCFPLNNFSSNHSSTFYVVDYGDGSALDTLPHPPPATICHTYSGSSCGEPGNAFVFRIKAINRCDSSEASISPIRVYSGPQADFTLPVDRICAGTNVTMLNSTTTGFNSSCSSNTVFSWDFGDGQTLTTLTLTNPIHNYSIPGNYTITLTATNNCGSSSQTRELCVELLPVPSFALTPASGCVPLVTQTINTSDLSNTCQVTPNWQVLFNGSTCMPSSGLYQFTNGTGAGSNAPQITFNSPGTYTVRLYMTNSCGSPYTEQTVTVQAPPQLAINPVTAICAGNTVSPSAVVNDCYENIDSYNWSFPGGLPATAGTLTPGAVSYPADGIYTLTLTAENACGTISTSTNLTVNPIPPALNPQSNSPVCSGDTAFFTADAVAGVVYNWSGPGGFSSSTQNFNLPNVNSSNAGTYTLTGTIGSCSGPASGTSLTVHSPPVVVIDPNPATICSDSSITLTASGAVSYTWSAHPTLNTTSGPLVEASPAATTIYTVTGSDGLCSSTASATINVNPLPIVSAGPDTVLCDQPVPVQLYGTPSGGNWSGNGIASNGIYTPAGTGTFPVVYTFTDLNGCSNSDTAWITVNPPISVNAGNDTIVCAATPDILLTGIPAGGSWSGSNTTAGGIFSPTSAGSFPVSYILGSGTCLTTDTLLITVLPLPATEAGNDIFVCPDEAAFTINGTPTGGSWSGNGITDPSGMFSPDVAGTGIHVLIYNHTDPLTGCSNVDSLNATVFPLPAVFAGNDTTLCNQPVPVPFSGIPGNGTWSGASIDASGLFIPSGTGIFEAVYTFTDANSCVNTDTLEITVTDPQIADAGGDFALCEDEAPQTLAASPAGGTWSGSGVTAGGTFTPPAPGISVLIYTFGSGSCLTRDTLSITVHSLPTINVPGDTSVCSDTDPFDQTGLPAGGSWIGTGITNPASGTFNPVSSGTGTHTATYNYTDPLTGCSNSDSVIITVNPLPTVNAGSDTALCNQPIAVTFTGTPGGGNWSGSGITPGGTFTPASSGTFTVAYTFTDVNGCTAVDDKVITVNDPTPANAGNDFSICIDAPVQQLNGAPAGGVWSGTGISATGQFTPVTAGTFELVYSYGAGTCATTDTLYLTVNPLPVVNAGSDFSLCSDAPTVFLNGTPSSGSWTGNGITNPTGEFTPAAAGTGNHTLTYTYTDLNGCSANDQLIATVNSLPNVQAGPDTTVCDQPDPVLFAGTPAGGLWSGTFIASDGTFTPSGTGTFSVNYVYTDPNGCSAADSRLITVVAPEVTDAGPDLETCIHDPNIVLNGVPASGTWTGTDVTPGGVFSPLTAGTHSLIISNGSGNCLTRDTMIFTVHSLPLTDAGTDADFCPGDAPFNFSGLPAGGTWIGTGITDNLNGMFDPSIAGTGTHTVVYSFTDPVTGCINTDTLTATVHPLPAVAFSHNPVACTGIQEQLTNNSDGMSYNWDFGDGNTSASVHPMHTWITAGFFNVQVVATSAFGCMDSLTRIIEVREPPVADFTFAPDSACGPLVVSFNNLSSGSSASYNWDFGNGQTDQSASPGTQIYPAGVLSDTTYAVTLSVSNFCGSDTHTDQIVAMPSPTAVFGTNTNIGCSPLQLDITNNSYGLPDAYYWDFGDGTTGSNANGVFQHTYTTGSDDTTYTLMLIAYNECGSDTAYHSITVLPVQVNAFFNVDAPSGCTPHTVNLSQFSTGASFYSWDFGDGNVSATHSPTHTFTTAGTYTVSLFVNDGCGYDTATALITVYPGPSIAFSSAPDSVCVNESFSFTNLSSGLAGMIWDFGDGTTSSLSDPVHTYANSGTYTVTLSGTSQTNGCTGSISHPVIVSTNPTAAFTPSPNSGCVNLQVTFGNSSGNTSFQSWDFGDGNTSSVFSPSHTYTSPGSYTVRLYVENANGCADSTEQIITVYPLPAAAFSVTSSDACVPPVNVNFTNTSSGAVSYDWDFGNGQTSQLNNPATVYMAPGSYTIQLTATTIYGCQSSVSQTFQVYQAPLADFTLPEDTVCAGTSMVFQSSGNFADSLIWDFGNGDYFAGASVQYTFPDPGIFPITLIAYGQGGCSDTLIMSTPVVVHPAPVAGFDFVNIQNPDPLSGIVEFTNTSTNADNYLWDFGNGDTSTTEHPVERYNSFGTFDVTLIAYNQYGCSDTARQTVEVDFFYGLFIPNAISPGHSNFEVANFIPKGVGLKTFELLIYDDWGNLIWQTSALDANGRPTEYWDGTFNGVPVQQDAYVWKASATFLNERVWEGKEYSKGKLKRSGTVTVIR